MGPSSDYSVDGSAGRANVPVGKTRGGTLTGLNTTDQRVTVDLRLDQAATGSGSYITVPARSTSAGNYRARLRYLSDGRLQATLARYTTAETTLASTTLSGVSVGQTMRIRFELEGKSPTKLRGKYWPANQAEPAAWTLSATDSTPALQVSGTSGLELYASSSSAGPSTFRVDRYTVAPLGGVPANRPPVARIDTPSVNGLKASLSGAGSSDPDGTIVAYAWTFGDNTTGTGAQTTHTYAKAGTYQVSLKVTDNNGATDTATAQVSVTAPVACPLAKDGFGRTTSNGWGTAETGGAWSVLGTGSRYAVANGVGKHALSTAGATTYAALADVQASSADLRTTVSWSRTAETGTLYTSLVPRRVSAVSDYRCNAVVSSNGAITLYLIRRVNSTETSLAAARVTGITQAANQGYRIACRATSAGGGTQLGAKLWKTGAAEPTSWQVSTTDSTAALQARGGVGVTTYMSSSAKANVTTSFDDLVAVDPNA